MKGYVHTPSHLVDMMVVNLFSGNPPKASSVVLDPGCGDGAFIEGLIQNCQTQKMDIPRIIGIELNPELIKKARKKFKQQSQVTILKQDYLEEPIGPVDYIIGNPPYVPITGLNDEEKRRYRRKFSTAIERFDLYILFFERSIQNLKQNGRLCFVTPEKYEYVHSAYPLRKILGNLSIEEINHIDESTFGNIVAYPTVTTVVKRAPSPSFKTKICLRDGSVINRKILADGASWSGLIHGSEHIQNTGHFLEDYCIRISCGVATGADRIFILDEKDLPTGLKPFAHPTISGRQLGLAGQNDFTTSDVMLIPYDKEGKLLPENRLGDLTSYLHRPDIKRKLKERSCIRRGNRIWYQFHDNVPFQDMLRKKILCKDITQQTYFWPDPTGEVVPRHSVYYIIPKENISFNQLLGFLNSEEAKSWLMANSQRAANGFYRLQSNILKKLPIPTKVMKIIDPNYQSTLGPQMDAPLHS